MKLIWEPGDIYAGRRYSKPGLHIPREYLSISLHDGMCTQSRSAEEIAEVLTEEGYIPLELIR